MGNEVPQKILVIRFSSLGDILLTFPVYKALKEKFPQAKISVLTKSQFAQILSSNRYVDEILVFRGVFSSVKKIDSENFDLVIDLHANLRSRLICALAGTRRKIRYRKDSFYRRIFVNWKIITPSLQKHTVERYIDCLKELGIQELKPELYLEDLKTQKSPQQDKGQSFLLLQTAFLGDSLLSLPLARALKENFPNCKLTVLIRPENSQIFSGIKEIDEILIDNKKTASSIPEFFRLLGELKKRKFDAALVPHRSFRSALLVWLAGIPVRIGFRFGLWSMLFTDAQPFGWPMHDVERNMLLLTPLKTLSSPSFPGLSSDVKLPAELSGLSPRIAINPSSVWKTKRWPREYFVSLIRKIKDNIGVPCILTGGNKEADYNLEIEKALPSGYCINLTGKTDLSSLVSIIKSCDLFITNDSGPMHIAAALKIPTIAIFGPTTKELGFFPYSEKAKVIEEKLSCRPCRLHGSHSCPRGHFLCMKLITPERVFNEILKFVEYKP